MSEDRLIERTAYTVTRMFLAVGAATPEDVPLMTNAMAETAAEQMGPMKPGEVDVTAALIHGMLRAAATPLEG